MLFIDGGKRILMSPHCLPMLDVKVLSLLLRQVWYFLPVYLLFLRPTCPVCRRQRPLQSLQRLLRRLPEEQIGALLPLETIDRAISITARTDQVGLNRRDTQHRRFHRLNKPLTGLRPATPYRRKGGIQKCSGTPCGCQGRGARGDGSGDARLPPQLINTVSRQTGQQRI